MTGRKYDDGQIIEYTSFSNTGWSTGQVVRYARPDEQTRRCPNCDQLAVPETLPGHVIETLLRRCPRCEASVIFPPLDPLVYIRNHSDGRPFGSPMKMRETQLRPRETEGTGHL
jgi:ribosomal protein S27AE